MDGVALGSVIDSIVFHKDLVEMIDAEYLTSLIFTTVQMQTDLSEVRVSKSSSDFEISALSNAVNVPQNNELVVRTWLARAKDRKSTLVFCVDVGHVVNLTATFRTHGIDAHFVTNKSSKKERAEKLTAFKKREFPVLVNCGIYTEGTDVPNIDCVLLARPTRSQGLLSQMIGRGARLFPGKENCHVIDMVASLQQGVVCTPTLFGLDSSEILENADLDELRAMRKEREREKQLQEYMNTAKAADDNTKANQLRGNVVMTDYDSINDLVGDSSGDQQIRKLSPFAWVHINSRRYVLNCRSEGDYLSLEKEKESWTVKYLKRIPFWRKSKSPFMTPRTLFSSEDFKHAVHGADTFVKNQEFPRVGVLKSASWRGYPATEKQLAFLNSFRDSNDQLTEATTTKGRAADMITRFKHGARGLFNKSKRENAKASQTPKSSESDLPLWDLDRAYTESERA
ncbi:putative ATP-dependent helicase IRC3 [Elasticomyces elasticus]|nr:putative ATP-dependent helicase IRC3 [Elasticomyces elasticus]